jgi:hypothetical protein
MEFRFKFPSVYDPNSIYWLRPKPSVPPDPSESESDAWRIPEDDEIPHKFTPPIRPMVCTFARSLSFDGLSKPSPVPLAKRSPDTLACWTVSFGLQHVRYWAPESTSVEAIVNGAAAEAGIPKTQWRTRLDNKFHIYCEDLTSGVREASIHFGNVEWRGKVDPTYGNLQLVRAAQAQSEIEGNWAVRTSHWDGQLRCLEAERLEPELVYPDLPEDSEVWFDFRGCVKKSAVAVGATRNDQARTAQELFNQTLLCSPITHAGDHYDIICTKPSVYPVILVHNTERVRTWVDSTAVKVIQEEARRLFGAGFKIERDITQPGLVY